jgi:anaerobic magnesium-protoporphyrin IX monomethyl ester cyclase
LAGTVVLIYVQGFDGYGREGVRVPEECNLPLGVLSLGTYLRRHGIGVRLMDTRFYTSDEFYAELLTMLDSCMAVGLSVMTPNVGISLEISGFVKKHAPGVKTVWGGVHPSLYPDSTIASPLVDLVIEGEGELGLRELCGVLSSGSEEYGRVPGLRYKRRSENGGTEYCRGMACAAVDLAELGPLQYDLLPVRRYVPRVRSADNAPVAQLEVLTSRGCPQACSFCVNVVLNKRRWRAEPLEVSAQNIRQVVEEYGAKHLFFMDEDLFCNLPRARELVEIVAAYRVTWEANCRADFIREGYVDRALLRRLKETGCVRLRFGLESGSPRILELLRKGITVAQSEHAVRELSRAGIVPSGSFMMGLPSETVRDVSSTVRLITRLLDIAPQAQIIGPLVFRPYPGGELFDLCTRAGMRVPEKLDEWSEFFMHTHLEEYRRGVPWFAHTYLFKAVQVCMAFLSEYRRIPMRIKTSIVRFQAWTGFKFVSALYAPVHALKMLLHRYRLRQVRHG